MLRFVEEWEYHEIASSQAVPIGTVQWRVFNLKKRLRCILNPWPDLAREGAQTGNRERKRVSKAAGQMSHAEASMLVNQ